MGIAPGECRGLSRSALSYANNHRGADLFEAMLEKAQKNKFHEFHSCYLYYVVSKDNPV